MAIWEPSASTKSVLTTSIGLASGLLAWENEVTKQWVQYNAAGTYGILDTHRFEDAIASTFGNSVMKRIDPSYTGGATFYKVNPWGVVNKTSVTGGVVLVLSELADDIGAYKHFKPYVEAAALGGLVGGALGGLLDPPPGNTDMPQTGQTNVQQQGPGSYQVATQQVAPQAVKGWSA